MRYYCTYFDQYYFLRGLTLYRSLQAHAGSFTLWVLCFDAESYDGLRTLDLPDLIPISLEDFERGDTDLLAAKQNRSRVEYYFTCTPSLPRYILRHFPQVDLLTYLDADLFLYASPEPIFEELGDGSILIIAHRFPPGRPHLWLSGIYNVGLLGFRRDSRAEACVEWWRARCLEWCYDRMEPGRFADQKYLDDWPERFPGVVVLQHPGAGLAPWNWMNSDIRFHGDETTVGGQPLIFFHFHGLKIFSPWVYDPVTGGRSYGEMPLSLRWHLYPPYMRCLQDTARWARGAGLDVHIRYTDVRTSDYAWYRMLRKIIQLRLMPAWNLR